MKPMSIITKSLKRLVIVDDSKLTFNQYTSKPITHNLYRQHDPGLRVDEPDEEGPSLKPGSEHPGPVAALWDKGCEF